MHKHPAAACVGALRPLWETLPLATAVGPFAYNIWSPWGRPSAQSSSASELLELTCDLGRAQVLMHRCLTPKEAESTPSSWSYYWLGHSLHCPWRRSSSCCFSGQHVTFPAHLSSSDTTLAHTSLKYSLGPWSILLHGFLIQEWSLHASVSTLMLSMKQDEMGWELK